MNAAELGGKLVGDRGFVYIKKGVLPDVAREVRKLGLPGVNVDRVAERVYPNGTLAGNVIGFVNSNGVGPGGPRGSLDKRLTGTAGSETYERGRMGQAIPGGYSKDDPGPAGRLGACSRSSPTCSTGRRRRSTRRSRATGLGLGLADRDGRQDRRDLRAGRLRHASTRTTRATGRAARCRAPISDVFEPGSTGKVITMSAILDNHVATPTSQFQVPYAYSPDGKETFHDSHEHGGRRTSRSTGILAESSNTGTVMVGQNLPVQTRYDYLKKFGFGAKTGIEMPGESVGILHPVDTWQRRDKFAVLFGQSRLGDRAPGDAGVRDDRQRRRPRPAAHHQGLDVPGRHVHAGRPRPTTTQVVSPETAKTVLTMMESVVDDGTGASAAIPGYRVAGKTGTAQDWVANGNQGITASFIGVAPADDPRIAVAVILHNPRTLDLRRHGRGAGVQRRRRLHARRARRGAVRHHGDAVPDDVVTAPRPDAAGRSGRSAQGRFSP